MGFCLVVLGIFIYNLKHPVEKKFKERSKEQRKERSIERLFSVATTKASSPSLSLPLSLSPTSLSLFPSFPLPLSPSFPLSIAIQCTYISDYKCISDASNGNGSEVSGGCPPH